MGTISMPRALASLAQDVTASTVTSNADPVAIAVPFARAIRSSSSSFFKMLPRSGDASISTSAAAKGAPCWAANSVCLATRRGAIIKIKQAAFGNVLNDRGHGRGFCGETSTHIVHNARIVRNAAHRLVQVFQYRLWRCIDSQRVAAGVDARIVERLKRDLHEDFVAVLACCLHPAAETVAFWRERQRDFSREYANGLLRTGLGQAEAANDDGDAGAARAGPWPGIDVESTTAIRGDDRKRPLRALFKHVPLGKMCGARILHTPCRIADDDNFGSALGTYDLAGVATTIRPDSCWFGRCRLRRSFCYLRLRCLRGRAAKSLVAREGDERGKTYNAENSNRRQQPADSLFVRFVWPFAVLSQRPVEINVHAFWPERVER